MKKKEQAKAEEIEEKVKKTPKTKGEKKLENKKEIKEETKKAKKEVKQEENKKETKTKAKAKATTKTTEAKVGLLRFGELMSGQFDRYSNNTYYWTLTPYSTSNVRYVYYNGYANNSSPSSTSGVRPSINLKSNVQITSGTGLKNDPFTLELSS